jgi:hypothetical protein
MCSNCDTATLCRSYVQSRTLKHFGILCPIGAQDSYAHYLESDDANSRALFELACTLQRTCKARI